MTSIFHENQLPSSVDIDNVVNKTQKAIQTKTFVGFLILSLVVGYEMCEL